MTLLYSLFFGAGVAGFAYSKFGRQVGYSNTQSIIIFVGAIFIVTTIVFYTLAKMIGIN